MTAQTRDSLRTLIERIGAFASQTADKFPEDTQLATAANILVALADDATDALANEPE